MPVCPFCFSKYLAEEENCPTCNNRKAITKSESSDIPVFTISNPGTFKIIEELGVIYGASSKVAFWGASKQSDRLSSAFEAAMANLKEEAAIVGADAVIGLTFALNNSTGSSASLGGSSEAVMIMGTAVKIAKLDQP